MCLIRKGQIKLRKLNGLNSMAQTENNTLHLENLNFNFSALLETLQQNTSKKIHFVSCVLFNKIKTVSKVAMYERFVEEIISCIFFLLKCF